MSDHPLFKKLTYLCAAVMALAGFGLVPESVAELCLAISLAGGTALLLWKRRRERPARESEQAKQIDGPPFGLRVPLSRLKPILFLAFAVLAAVSFVPDSSIYWPLLALAPGLALTRLQGRVQCADCFAVYAKERKACPCCADAEVRLRTELRVQTQQAKRYRIATALLALALVLSGWFTATTERPARPARDLREPASIRR